MSEYVRPDLFLSHWASYTGMNCVLSAQPVNGMSVFYNLVDIDAFLKCYYSKRRDFAHSTFKNKREYFENYY